MSKPIVTGGDAGKGIWGWTQTTYDFDDPEQLEEYCKVNRCTKEEALNPDRWTGQTLIDPNRKATPKDG